MSVWPPDEPDADRAGQPFDPGEPPSLEAENRPLTSIRWGVGEAAALVAVAMAFTVLAGIATSHIYSTNLGADAESAAIGTVLLVAYAGQVAAVWVSAWSRGARFAPAVGVREFEPVRSWVLAAVGLALGMRVFETVYELGLERLGLGLAGQGLDITRVLPPGVLGIGLTIVLLVVVAPFAEEVVFRGVLLSSIRSQWGTWAGILGSAAIFSAVHLNPYSFLPLFMLAAGLGWLYVRSKSLWVAVLAHASFNAIGIVAAFTLKALGLQ